MNILVTAANSQLAQCIKQITNSNQPKNNWLFTSHQQLDITNHDQTESFINDNKINVIINCAAYTNVNKAETDLFNATQVNTLGPYNLAFSCLHNNATLIHISTDYVFDGNSNIPYQPISPKESSFPIPLNTYGRTKLNGEIAVSSLNINYLIFRTSWLYSPFENNFVKTILSKLQSPQDINVIIDQIGSLTSAMDLANFLFHIIEKNPQSLSNIGTYHFANKGIASWYDIASFIKLYTNAPNNIIPITTNMSLLPKRPHYSVLDTTLTELTFNYSIPNWMSSLSNFLETYKIEES